MLLTSNIKIGSYKFDGITEVEIDAVPCPLIASVFMNTGKKLKFQVYQNTGISLTTDIGLSQSPITITQR